MDKRDIVLKIMDQIEGWADDNDIAASAIEQIELAERIYNSELEIYQGLLDAARNVLNRDHFYHNILSCDLHRLPVSVPDRNIDYRPSNKCTCALGPLEAAVNALKDLP